MSNIEDIKARLRLWIAMKVREPELSTDDIGIVEDVASLLRHLVESEQPQVVNDMVSYPTDPPQKVPVFELTGNDQAGFEVDFGGDIVVRGRPGGMHRLRIDGSVLTVDVIPNELK